MAGHIGPVGLVGQMPEARSSEVRYRNGIRLVEAMGGIAERNLELALPFDHPAGEKTRIAFRPKRWRLFPMAR